MKQFLILLTVGLVIVGCGSSDSSMNAEEVKAFAPPKDGAPRSKEAQDKIAEHMRKFNEKHGTTNAPSQAQVPGQGK